MDQLSFNENGEIFIPPPTRIAFIDESGGFGFDFSKKATTKYYTLCAVIIKQKDQDYIRSKVEAIRSQHFGDQEMKSSKIGGDIQRRKRIIKKLEDIEFNLMLLTVNKQRIRDASPLSEYKGSFIKFFCDGLIQKLYISYPKVKIIYDQLGYPEFQAGFRKYVEKNKKLYTPHDNFDFNFAISHEEVMLQVADIIAGTINRSFLYETESFFRNELNSKVLSCEIFPQDYESYLLDIQQLTKGELNSDILEICYRCIQVFLEKNKASNDEWIYLQKEFVNYLLFQSRINPKRFVYSQEILGVLSEIRTKKVQPNHLYRQIIAPLRDAGVLIASSAQGYKIPVCYEDIKTYINQTSGVVSPMLHRLGICRDTIRKQTDGKVDILEVPQLERFKKFLDC